MKQQLERYSRQVFFSGIGEAGQNRIAASAVLVVGCGALGSNIANLLVRAGVGTVKIVDRDFVELSNLQRQVLFDEADAEGRLPKAVAAVKKLQAINANVQVEAVIQDVNARNIEALVTGVDLVMDATDNMETRYLVNDTCVKHGIPWIYGGVIGATGMTMDIIPGQTACLRCLSDMPPAPGTTPTCETEGVLGGTPAMIASIQATEALKIMVGHKPVGGNLIHIDLWENEYNRFQVNVHPDCPTCMKKRFDFLNGEQVSEAFSLCGRNAVQISASKSEPLDLEQLGIRLSALGEVVNNGYFLTFTVDEYELVIFPEGRTIIKGTADEVLARSLFARYVGN